MAILQFHVFSDTDGVRELQERGIQGYSVKSVPKWDSRLEPGRQDHDTFTFKTNFGRRFKQWYGWPEMPNSDNEMDVVD